MADRTIAIVGESRKSLLQEVRRRRQVPVYCSVVGHLTIFLRFTNTVEGAFWKWSLTRRGGGYVTEVAYLSVKISISIFRKPQKNHRSGPMQYGHLPVSSYTCAVLGEYMHYLVLPSESFV